MKAQEFKLHLWVSNGGDGSANIHAATSFAEAKMKCDEQDEGWGENSAISMKILIQDNRLYYQDYQSVDGKYKWVWVEVSQQ